MINDTIKYSAVTAKARAMYGKLLKDADWEKLLQAASLREVWQFLSRSDGWAAAAEEPRCAEEGAVMLQSLSRQMELDVKRLCLYLNRDDRAVMEFFLRRPSGEAMTLEETKRWWHDAGAKNAGLRRIAGAEADALNLVYVLRLRRFPASAAKTEELLIPVRNKLSPALVGKLLSARDDAAVRDLLSATPWGDVFTSLEPGALEKQYGDYMAAFCRRVLASANPGLTAVQAFLTLKEMERRRLERLVGAVQRGIDPALAV